jgi:hypothetical protein
MLVASPHFTLGVGMVVLLALLAWKLPKAHMPSANIAFAGNSIMFVNDLPRFFQAVSGEQIYQNSCLHGSLNLMSILQRGNGMYNKWNTLNAVVAINTTDNSTIYDFGACSVPQLLFGRDESLSVDNKNGAYVKDGKNPCFEDPNYLPYLQKTYNAPTWDYIVMNDNTGYPGTYSKRQKSLRALRQVYANMFLESGSRPVLLETHGYDVGVVADDDDGTITEDDNPASSVPVFTSRVHYGYQVYAHLLAEYLPPTHQPILAPVGLAFLLLWEENFGLWKKLFFYDGFHPSAHGTYLIGCVVYAAIFGRMPPAQYALNRNVEQLWSNARKMQLKTSDDYPTMPFPTFEEANYLYIIAERVVLRGHTPKSLLTNAQVVALEEQEYDSDSSFYSMDDFL